MVELTSNDWRALIGAITVNFLLVGSSRLSTIFFVESITYFNATRKEASLVYILAYLTRTLSGPVIGYTDQIFGLKKVIITGCVLSTISIGLCFFAEDILTLTILWGILNGFGVGLSHLSMPPFLNQHFSTNRSRANGVALAFVSLGSIVLPPIVQASIDFFGFSGTLLILSAVVAHTIPATLLMPSLTNKIQSKINETYSASDVNSETEFSRRRHINENATNPATLSMLALTNEIKSKISEKYPASDVNSENESSRRGHTKNEVTLPMPALPNKIQFKINEKYLTSDVSSGPEFSSRRHINEEDKDDCNKEKNAINPVNRSMPELTNKIQSKINEKYPVSDVKRETKFSSQRHVSDEDKDNCIEEENATLLMQALPNKIQSKLIEKYPVCNVSETEILSQRHTIKENKDNCAVEENAKKFSKNRILMIFINPAFIVMLVINGFFIFITLTIWTVILDYSLDKNLDEGIKTYIVTIISVSDLLGRFWFGFIIDSKYMEVAKLTFICFLSSGLLIIGFVFLYNAILVVMCQVLMSFTLGSIYLLTIALVPEFIEDDKRTLALTSKQILGVPLALTTPSIIGYFRETRGSYDEIFYILGSISIFCGFATFLLPYLTKKKIRTSNLDTIS